MSGCRVMASVVACIGVVLTGCADETSHQSVASLSASVAPVSAPLAPPWRFVKRPIVVVSQPAGAREPSYTVYFRLDRALATRHHAVLVMLNGVSNYDTTGTGYDDSIRPHCYTKAIDNFKDFPRWMLRPRAADLVTVSLRFRRPPRNRISARVPLQISGPGDPGWSSPGSERLRMLGCAS